MHCASGTLCSLHQPSLSAGHWLWSLAPTRAENFGSVQSVVCPQTATLANRAATVTAETTARIRRRGGAASAAAPGCRADCCGSVGEVCLCSFELGCDIKCLRG